MNTQKHLQLSLAFLWLFFQLSLSSLHAKERPMTEVLQEFTEIYEVLFSYDPLLIEPLEVEFSLRPKESFEVALERLLKPFELGYESFEKKFCVIFKKGEEIEQRVISLKVDRQKTQLLKFEGMIEDAETGEKVPYANIKLNGSNQHTVADAHGRFVLPIIPTASTEITISSIGYKQKTQYLRHSDIPLTITLTPQPYYLKDEEIVPAIDILYLAFAVNQHEVSPPFKLDMKLSGNWEGLDEESEYELEAITQFHYYKKEPYWLGLIKEVKYLKPEKGYGFIPQVGLYTHDLRKPPFNLKKKKLWDKYVSFSEVELIDVEGEKLYKLSYSMSRPDRKRIEGSPFSIALYESELLIRAKDYRIFQQRSVMTVDPEHVHSYEMGRDIWTSTKFQVIRVYEVEEGKNFLSSLETNCFFESIDEDTQEVKESVLTHKLETIEVLTGPKQRQPNIKQLMWGLGDFDMGGE